jgi:hypothetical protein
VSFDKTTEEILFQKTKARWEKPRGDEGDIMTKCGLIRS